MPRKRKSPIFFSEAPSETREKAMLAEKKRMALMEGSDQEEGSELEVGKRKVYRAALVTEVCPRGRSRESLSCSTFLSTSDPHTACLWALLLPLLTTHVWKSRHRGRIGRQKRQDISAPKRLICELCNFTQGWKSASCVVSC